MIIKMKQSLRFLLVSFLMLLQTACVKNLDFNQIKDYEATPAYTTTLVYFTLNQNNFLYQGYEINELSNTFPFNTFSSAYFRENLVKVDLIFKINNQFRRDFEVKMDFLDSSDSITYQIAPFIIKAYDPKFERTEEIAVANNEQLLAAKKVKITLKMSPSSNGAPLDSTIVRTFNFQSAASVYLKEK